MNLLTSILASSMAFIDGSALNVALSAMQKDLHASALELIWIVNSYNIPVSALILLGGALGDRFGIKRIFAIGIIIFISGSILCGLAPTASFLIAARVLQGVGGALMIPSSLSYLTITTTLENRGKAIGTWSSFSTLTTIIGPILGGFLAGAGLWRMVFYINVPLGLGALFTLYKNKNVPEVSHSQPVDYTGALLITLSLALLSGSLLSSQNGLIAGSLIFFLLFIFVERKKKSPMIPFQIFKSRVFSGVNLMTVLLYSTLYGVLFFIPLNLIQVQKYSDSMAGTASLPFALLIIFLSPFAGKFSKKFGPRALLTVGPLFVGVAFILLASIGITGGLKDYWTTFFLVYILFGLGMGLVVAPLTTTAMTALPPSQSGLASGINNAAARVAGVLAMGGFGFIFLGFFKTQMITKLSGLNLSSTHFNFLQDQLKNLMAIHVPENLTTQTQNAIHGFAQESFISSFKNISIIGAILCLLSSLVSFTTLKNDI